ncbi:hypothetical protein Ga0123462_0067 [Mariprofundus ferrinatatus]|uniref:Antitoxin VbhA domain-containing protein n=1 Tax=Mariprofundus ferrinatatus TaxID=1921087 RepID=A0A2K8L9J0_9PROT|nr:hypothetical protein [Mariprofundus ferrinatatus]ATX80946.1 hypothetical protein Ga0123462_0067 [Mariprofundus ferrinatatus]
MNECNASFGSAEEWREKAMQRSGSIDGDESERRSALAEAHNRKHKIIDPDILADQQLYILGKMDLEEYQAYLLFKHGKAG